MEAAKSGRFDRRGKRNAVPEGGKRKNAKSNTKCYQKNRLGRMAPTAQEEREGKGGDPTKAESTRLGEGGEAKKVPGIKKHKRELARTKQDNKTVGGKGRDRKGNQEKADAAQDHEQAGRK